MTQKIAIFKAGDGLYGVPIGETASIIPYDQPLTKVVPRAVYLGVRDHLDTVWTIFDLGCILFGSPTKFSARSRILLLANSHSGFAVEDIIAIETVDDAQIRGIQMGDDEFSVAILDESKGYVVILLSLAQVLEEYLSRGRTSETA